MQIGLSTHLFLEQVLDEALLSLIKLQGFSRLEIWGMRPHFDYQHRARIARLASFIRAQQMQVVAVHAPLYTHLNQGRAGQWLSLSAPSKGAREAALAEHLALLEVLPLLSCPLLVVHPGGLHDQAEASLQKNVKQSLQTLLAHCRPKGIRIALENINSALGTPQRVLQLLQELAAPGLGMCLDLGHASLVEEQLPPLIERVAGWLFHLHASDNDGCRDLHQAPFAGIVSWQKVQDVLQKINYQGSFVWELRGTGDYGDILSRLYLNSGKIFPFLSPPLKQQA